MFKILKKVPYVYLLLFVCLSACKKDDEGNKQQSFSSISFEQSSWEVNEDRKIELKIKVDGRIGSYYDSDLNALNLIWSTPDNDILSVNQKGEVTGLKTGKGMVFVESADQKHSISTEVIVYNSILTNKISKSLNADMIYSKDIYLVRNTVIQCFDIDSKGTIYYDQLGGQLAHVIFLVKGEPNQDYSSSMQLKYFGSGTNMAIEEVGEDRYVWMGSNGHKAADGSYGDNQTFSRFKYVPDGIIENYAPETYYLPGKNNIHPAIDQENDILAVMTSGGGDPLRYFYIYKLSEAKALTPSLATLSRLKFGGEEIGGAPEQTVAPTISVKHLNKLTPIATFSFPRGANYGQIDSYPFQGFDISEGKLYFFEGVGNNNTTAGGPSNAYVTVFDYMTGQKLSQRTKVEAIADMVNLNTHEITATGFMEAGGIKMKNGNLYLGFVSKSTDDKYRANIFIYR